MLTVIFLIAAIAWFIFGDAVFATVFRLRKTYRPSPAMIVAISAARNLASFVIVFALLYAMKIDFDNAGNWFERFQR